MYTIRTPFAIATNDAIREISACKPWCCMWQRPMQTTDRPNVSFLLPFIIPFFFCVSFVCFFFRSLFSSLFRYVFPLDLAVCCCCCFFCVWIVNMAEQHSLCCIGWTAIHSGCNTTTQQTTKPPMTHAIHSIHSNWTISADALIKTKIQTTFKNTLCFSSTIHSAGFSHSIRFSMFIFRMCIAESPKCVISQ